MIRGLVAGGAATLTLWVADIPARLGAHPFWDQQVIWIGAAIGAAGFVAGAALRRLPHIGFLIVISVLALLCAHFGKTAFAASFGENIMAGRAWYFGWILACASIIAASCKAGHPKT